jgi:hypothetical protein
VVPDDVASLTVHYPAGEANPGYHTKPVLPAVTINTKPIDNVVLYNVHRASGGAAFAPVTMTWHATDGHVIKTFNRL